VGRPALAEEPHALASASLGKSQQAVSHLLGTVIAEQASCGPAIVLLDEVETLAADRSKLSLEANPVDVHRATDAVLAQLDQLADKHPQLLFVATSNFPKAIDSAFLSRVDQIVTIDLPSAGDRIHEEWPEPAELGPPVSDGMTSDEKKAAQRALKDAGYVIRQAINAERGGNTSEALRIYRGLFGSRFPLS
jgi:hypothetical protein